MLTKKMLIRKSGLCFFVYCFHLFIFNSYVCALSGVIPGKLSSYFAMRNIFIGKVESISTIKHYGTEVHFSMIEAIKGGKRDTIIIYTGLGGADGKIDFKVGTQYVVYAFKHYPIASLASRDKGKKVLLTTTLTRTKPLSEAEQTGEVTYIRRIRNIVMAIKIIFLILIIAGIYWFIIRKYFTCKDTA